MFPLIRQEKKEVKFFSYLEPDKLTIPRPKNFNRIPFWSCKDLIISLFFFFLFKVGLHFFS